MQTTLNKKKGSMIELSIALDGSDLKKLFTSGFNAFATQVKLPGFRTGKVPKEVIMREIGEERIWNEVLNQTIIPRSFVDAIRKEKLSPIDQPKINVEKFEKEKILQYTCVFSILPEIELCDYKKIKIHRRKIEVAEKEVDEAIERLCESRAKLVTVKRPAKKKDVAVIDFTGKIRGIPIEGGTTKNYAVEIGKGAMLYEFEENLIGLSANDGKTFSVTYPKNFWKKDLSGRKVDFDVKVKVIQEKILPKRDDAFAKSMGNFSTLAQLKDQLKKNLRLEKEEKEEEAREIEIIEKIASKSTFSDIPEVIINDEVNGMIENLKLQMKQSGGKMEDYLSSIEKSIDDLKKDFRKKAVSRIKSSFVIREIANQEKIIVLDQEVEDDINQFLRMYPAMEGKKEIMKRVNSKDYREKVRAQIRQKKVMAALKKIILK